MKKVFVLLCAAALAFTGCSKKDNQAKTVHTVVDHGGNTVVIPAEVNRVVIGSLLPMPSVYCLYAGSAEKIVGMPPSSMAAAKESLLAEAYPEILKARTDFISHNVINVETLLELKPDLVLYNSGSKEEKEIYEKAGIPAVGFSVGIADYNTIETYAAWIKLLEEVFGKTSRSQEVIEYGRQIEKEVLKLSSKIPEENKPKVMIIYSYNAGHITTYGQKMFPQYWISTVGGINVAQDLTGVVDVNMEQIYQWNPDIVILTNFNPKQPEDFYTGSVDGNDWSAVKAVQNHQVYKFPLGMYRWCPPCSDSPLSLQWLAKTIQPEVFKNYDIKKTTAEFFKKFYGMELTDAQLEKIFHSSRAASGVN